MKKGKLLLTALLCMSVTTLVGAAACQTEHTHTWGDWTITTDPTLTAGGKAEHFCTNNADGHEEVNIPALSDTGVWAKDDQKSAPATHAAAGKDVYTSVYGEVEVTINATGHTWGDWTLDTEPTLTTVGSATHTCTANDGGSETKTDVPMLSDTSVWTKDATKSTPATHTAGGKDVYTSVYGEVEVDTAATPDHTWGEWVLGTKPTLSTTGTATRNCTADDSGSETKTDVPMLSDTSVWTKDTEKSTPATHTAGGKDVYTSVYGEVEVEIAVQAHTWGEWVFTTEPTLETAGSATRTCTADDGGIETKTDIPALSDTTVWTKDNEKSTPAAHEVAGKDVYTSVYGEVEITIAAEEHTWGEWVLGTEPTLNTAGTATRTCTADDGGSETKTDVPALSDTTVWTVTEHTDATYEKGEVTVYSSIYGTVTVEDSEVLSYFADKTYYNITVAVYGDYTPARLLDTTGHSITLDKKGTGINGTGRPFLEGYTYKFEMVNEATGEISIDQHSSSGTNDKTVKAFYDSETGFIVMPNYDDFTNVHILVTSGAYDETYDSICGSAWTIGESFKFAITYTDGNGTTATDDDTVHNIYIEGKDGDAVHFGVSFKNGEGNTILGSEAYVSDYLYINDRDGKQIGAYGKDGSKLVKVDGLEGEYAVTVNEDITQEGSKIFLSGFGTVTLTTDDTHNGTYTVMENEGCDVLVVFADLNLSYYLTFNEDGSATLVIPRVTLNFELNGHGTITKTEAEVIPGLVYELEEPANDDATIVFMGWYYDSDFNNAVGTPFTPVAGGTLYAKWVAVPSYAGTYKGANMWNTSGSLTLTESNSVTISAKGEISGKCSGKVTSYDPETQLITWVDSESKTNYFFYDEVSGVIAANYNSTKNQFFTHDFFFFSKYETSVDYYGIKYVLPEHTPALSADSANLRVVKLKVDAEGTVKTIVLYYNRIYGNVTLTDLESNSLTVNTVKDATSLLVKDATTNEVLLALKAASGTLSGSNNTPLDAYFGTYTDQNSKTIVLDGTGKITYDGVEGTYTVSKEGEYTISALVGEGETLSYYEITLSGTTATTAKPTVEITLDFRGVTIAEDQSNSIVCNKNVPVTLPVLTDSEGAYLFDGWFIDAGMETPVTVADGKYTPAASITLYAGWIKKFTVHVHYNNSEVEFDEYVYVGDGKTLTVAEPQGICGGVVFDGFYTTEDLTDGSKWTNGSVVKEADGITDIYAKWVTPVPYYGTFSGKYISSGNHPTSANRNPLTIDAFGHAVGLGTSDWNKVTGNIIEYDATTGKFKLSTSGTSYYPGAFDAKNGVMVVDNGTGNSEVIKPLSTMFIVLFKGATNVSFEKTDGSQWNNAATTLINFTVDGEKITVFIHENRIYGNVSIYSVDGSVTAGNAYEANSFAVLDSDGNDIVVLKNGEFVSPDGLRGTYTDQNSKTIVLDGAGNLTYDGVVGTYTVSGEGIISALVGEGEDISAYDITLNGTSATTATPSVTIALDFNGVTVVEEQSNSIVCDKNVPITLPVLTDSTGTYIFDGWFIDTEIETPVELTDGKYVPAAGTTLYAGWIKKLTVHVHYNNTEVELDEYVYVGDGKALTVAEPQGVIGGKIFNGFYISEDFTDANKWTNGSVVTEADAISDLYASWKDIVPYYGTYAGLELYGAGSQPTVSSNNSSISVDAEGNANGPFGWSTKEGVIENYDKETGSISINVSSSIYIGAVDTENGVMIYNYNANKSGLENDIYVMLCGKTGVTCDKTKVSQWNSGLTKLATLTYTGGTMTVFVWNSRVWGNVSISSADGSVTSSNAYQAESFSVVSSNGKTIAIYKDGAFVSSDGLDATYTNASGTNLGNIVLDGAGNITAGANYGTYAITEGTTVEATLTVPSSNAYTLHVYTIVLDTANKTYTATEKQVEKVTVTLIFAQDGLCEDEQVTFEILSGTTPDLSAYTPNGANSHGNYFIGWFTDAERQTVYTPSGLSENMTVYAGWQEYLFEELYGNLKDTGSHSKTHLFLQWTYSDANNGTWRAECPMAGSGQLSNSNSYLLKITFAKAGTFSFDWAADYGDSYDGLFVGKNIVTNYPHDQSSPSFKRNSGSGTYTVDVEAGDFIYIDAFWDAYQSTATDYAQISNLHFEAAE